VNDGDEVIERVVVESVDYEWGDRGNAKRQLGTAFGPIAPGTSVEVLRETDTEVRTSVTLLVRDATGEHRIVAELGKLYRRAGVLADVPILGRKAAIAQLVGADPSPETLRDRFAAGAEPGATPWTGLRKLHGARTLTAPQASRGIAAKDLGQGVIVYGARSGGWVAVDVFTGETRWSSRTLTPLGTWWHDASWRIFRPDPLTGEPSDGIGSVPDALRGSTRPPIEVIGRHTIVDLAESYGSLDWGNEDPSEFTLSFFDLATGERTKVVEYEGGTGSLRGAGELAAVRFDGELSLFDRKGAVRWKRACRGDVLGVVDGRILVADDRILAFDLATGTPVRATERSWSRAAVTDASVIVRDLRRLAALDRTTLAPRWERELDEDFEVLATADAVLLLTLYRRKQWARHPRVRSVLALDPKSGFTLSSLDVASANCAASTATLSGGKLVMLCVVGGPSVVVVD
jgi:outer membrane protein assembly factor BamB